MLFVYFLISMWVLYVYSVEFVLIIESDYFSYNFNLYVGYYFDLMGGELIESIKIDVSWIKNIDGDVLNFGFINFFVWVYFLLILFVD